MTNEINNLKLQMVNAQVQGNQQQALRLETEVNRRSDLLKDYYKVQTDELERIKSRLSQSGTFLEQVYDEIKFIAESEGYSMVLNYKENKDILWYSQTVDITDKIIKGLMDKSGR
jgi:outer membrane protein